MLLRVPSAGRPQELLSFASYATFGDTDQDVKDRADYEYGHEREEEVGDIVSLMIGGLTTRRYTKAVGRTE